MVRPAWMPAVIVSALAALALAPGVAAAASWSVAGDMNTARDRHTATLLPNGKVLVAGGSNGTATKTAELYDPATNTWSPAHDMATARQEHTATLLANGKVLVAGGDNGATLKSAELYDPATNTWATKTDMGQVRRDAKAVLLPSGKVLMVGGGPGAEFYDPAGNTWTPTGAMVETRYFSTLTLLPNGKVLAAGGTYTKSAELYDPTANNWTATGSMHYTRGEFTATSLPDGRVLAAGGKDNLGPDPAPTELYDFSSGTWTVSGTLTNPRNGHVAALLATGKVLVAGAGGPDHLNSAELYDSGAGAWTVQPSMTTKRSDATATLLTNGKVLVAGGAQSGSPSDTLKTAELYTPDFPPGISAAVGAPLATASVAALSIRPSSFPAAGSGPSVTTGRKKRRRKTGTTISYTDTQPATATLTVLRRTKGRKVRKRRRTVCAKRTHKNRRRKRCTRYVKVGSFTHVDVAGKNTFHFTGRVKRRKLRPARYRLQIVAKGANGKASKSLVKSFRIVR